MDAAVHPLARQAIDYLQELGLPATTPRARRGTGSIPYFLTDAFDLANLTVADQAVLLAIDHDPDRSPADAEKLIERLRDVADDATPIYVTGALTSYDRKRLIERRVPFLVPGNQLYLPNLGLDLREHFRRPDATPADKPLSPSAQAMLISSLRRQHWTPEWAGAETAAALGYTPMTASRAAREIAAAGLAKTAKNARNLVLVFEHAPKDIWTQALPMLRNPVQKTVFARPLLSGHQADMNALRIAGIQQLSTQTMLMESPWPVFAVGRDEWPVWKPAFILMPRAETGNGTCEMQIWTYRPAVEPDPNFVDPLSLYLSLRDNEDPRVQSALDELMENVWQ